ncbi:DUF6480 family protein [Plantactinospora sp. WMMB334]|uniref:DUF6480 family protein n=1 Tax=Plantactinospora sp. WMMB334 TaxID=3404119 RepID=UPI003B930E0A
MKAECGGCAGSLPGALHGRAPTCRGDPAPAGATPPAESPREATGDRRETRGQPRSRRYGPWIALGAVVLLLLAAGLVVRAVLGEMTGVGGLTADSSCAEYRQAPPEERVAAIRRVGLAKGISGVDGPLVMTAIDQLCETQPSARLGDLLARLNR